MEEGNNSDSLLSCAMLFDHRCACRGNINLSSKSIIKPHQLSYYQLGFIVTTCLQRKKSNYPQNGAGIAEGKDTPSHEGIVDLNPVSHTSSATQTVRIFVTIIVHSLQFMNR